MADIERVDVGREVILRGEPAGARCQGDGLGDFSVATNKRPTAAADCRSDRVIGIHISMGSNACAAALCKAVFEAARAIGKLAGAGG